MEKKIPNIDSLMDGIGDEASRSMIEDLPVDNVRPDVTEVSDNSLWTELLDMLNSVNDESTPANQKIYRIDADIVETLSLCSFRNRSTGTVINCILRTFLIANIRKLDRLRRHAPSLFDNYLNNPAHEDYR